MLIPQHEEETPQAVVTLPAVAVSRLTLRDAQFPFHQHEAAENILISIQHQSQSVRAAVAAAVEFQSGDPVAAARYTGLSHRTRNSSNSSGESETINESDTPVLRCTALTSAFSCLTAELKEVKEFVFVSI
jgi:hypothetical protein